MQLAYKYKGLSKENKKMEGIIFAADQAQAFGFVKRIGVKKAEVSLEPGHTLSSIFSGTAFNQKELARFYKVIGKRLKAGKSIVDGLESAAEFIRKDVRLRSSVLAMRQFVLDGSPESDAMRLAGFPSRDCLVIKATQAAGRSGDAFISLAIEIENQIKLRSGIASVFRMPIILCAVMYAFFYGAITKIAPNTQAFLKSTGLEVKLSAFNEMYFQFANIVNSNLYVSNTIAAAIPCILFFLKKAGFFQKILDKSKVVKEISVKADHASLWGSFALMYDAGLQVRETCKLLSDAAGRQDSKESFDKLGKLVNVGLEPHKAIDKVGFPEFIANGYKSAFSAGNLSEGLDEMSKGLYEDVVSLTEILQENMKLTSMLVLSCGVGVIFFVTYYPIVASILSNV